MSHTELTLHDWLHQHGLQFDPFWALDASQDPRLREYIVRHDIFNAVWGDWVSFVFAPSGGGKTALRVNVNQSCWVGQRTNRPFPISYMPPYVVARQPHVPFEMHLDALSRAAAQQLLTAFAYRPHWLFDLAPADQQAVYHALNWNLPGPVADFAQQCQAARSLRPLRDVFGATYQLPDPPDATTRATFWNTLVALAKPATRPDAATRWEHIIHILLETLGFQALYVMIDGIDAIYETWQQPEVAIGSIADILAQTDSWQAQRIFIKGFFPSETQAALEKRYEQRAAAPRLVTIEWTPELLVEVVRKRLYAASDGVYSSLNAIGSPALPQNVEHVLAAAVPPLPREMIQLTRDVLKTHIARHAAGPDGDLAPEDIDTAIRRYHANSPLRGLDTYPALAEDNNG